MYCPECGGEYRPEIDTCPICEVTLTEQFEEPRLPMHSGPLVDLVGFIDEHEARDARRRLKQAGIKSELVIRDAFAPPRAAEREPDQAEADEQQADEFWIRVENPKAAAEVLGLEPIVSEDACPSCGAPVQAEETCPRCRQHLRS